MSEYIIDSSFLSEYERNIEELIGFELEYDDATNPTPLLREIVRCRDCKYVHHEPDWQPDKRRKPFDLWLCKAEWCEGIDGENPWVNPNGFCAWAERRDA